MFKNYLEQFGEYGLVDEVSPPIARISGLNGACLNEVVVFENGGLGQLISIGRSISEVLVFSNEPVTLGSRVARTGSGLKVGIGESFKGCVLDPLGNIKYSGNSVPQVKEYRLVDVKPQSISGRVRITETFFTGISCVDLLIPLGKGQRELVVGDRKTGKTSFLLSVLKYQALQNTVVIYSAIGKTSAEVKQIRDFIVDNGVQDNVIMVYSTSKDSPSLIYITPFTSMSIAEFFRDQGQNVLLILDDLSSHAKFYREIALLAKRFPGRDSYPGDIFFTHARLLERAGSFKTGSITCLPVGETLENDLANYIVSNLIGITDGHILFDSNDFLKGRRPAINSLLSITRVGKQTHKLLHQEINRAFLAFLVEYDKVLNYSHFGAELTDEVREKLAKGEKLLAFLDQPISLNVPNTVQVVFFGVIWANLLSNEPTAKLGSMRQSMLNKYDKSTSDKAYLERFLEARNLDEFVSWVSKNASKLLQICKA